MQHSPDRDVKRAAGAEPPGPDDLPIIHAYTRADALAEGSLIEIPRQAAYPSGFRAQVAMTRAVYLGIVADPFAATAKDDDVNRPFTNHEMQHMRMLCRNAAFKLATATDAAKNSSELVFGAAGQDLILSLGPDDDGEAVFTIMTEADR
jgi:hypothetical protein